METIGGKNKPWGCLWLRGQVAEGKGQGSGVSLQSLGDSLGTIVPRSGVRDGVCQRGPWTFGGRVSLRLWSLSLLSDGPH